jgi:translation initiation factor eIF-2B subunit alpha
MSVVPLPPAPLPAAGPSSHARSGAPRVNKDFDVVAAYRKALANHSVRTFSRVLNRLMSQVPHPIAAILALVELMESSTEPINHIEADCTATTSFGLAEDVKVGRETLMNTQSSLGVRAGCQLWERFFSLSRPGDLARPP